DAENVLPPAAADDEAELERPLARGGDAAIAFALVLLAAWICERERSFGRDWEPAGESVAGLVRGGEWWRAVTALTLHADATHLAANMLFGALFTWFTAQLAGTGVASLAVLLSGALGNAANAALEPPEHTSIGASTAVFGALGILAALHVSQRARERLPA